MIEIQQARNYLQHLDLTYIAESMCAAAYPLPRWNMVNAKRCEALYKDFLLLQKKHLPTSLVPTREIDEFWHNHILYTKNYFNDCMNIFGHYLHHTPASPNENQKELIDNFLLTKKLYLEEFNHPLELIIHG